VNYKLSKDYTYSEIPYSAYFMQFIGIAAQVPNVVFNWVNIFMNVG
jgi:equilibrative nucleoside transporter 1/2/3